MDFDSTKTFEENLLIFRAACEEVDQECAEILFQNIEKISGEYAKDRTARSTFNASVKAALEALPEEPKS